MAPTNTMRLLVINPNTNAKLTADIRAIAAASVPDVTVEGVTAPYGVDYIRTPEDSELALSAVVELADNLDAGYDAAMIASTSDTGLAEVRQRLTIPVTAMTESAMTAACMLGKGFSLVSFQPGSEAIAKGLAAAYGFTDRLRSVRVPTILKSGGTDHLGDLKEMILEAGRKAIDEDGAEVLLVGGAAACPITTDLTETLGIPVLDGITCAARQAQMLAGLPIIQNS